jgi:hypothetical protein
MAREILLVCCLVVFSLAAVVGCSQPPDAGASSATTSVQD